MVLRFWKAPATNHGWQAELFGRQSFQILVTAAEFRMIRLRSRRDGPSTIDLRR